MVKILVVHILSGDLILHKRTLGPVQTVIYGLRRYDVDRCAALVDASEADGPIKVIGYMSHKSKIYLVRAFFPAALCLCLPTNESICGSKGGCERPYGTYHDESGYVHCYVGEFD